MRRATHGSDLVEGRGLFARRLLLVGVLVLGGALRFYALGFGEGAGSARPDEGIALMAMASLPMSPQVDVLYGGGYFAPLRLVASQYAAWLADGPLIEQVDGEPRDLLLVARAWSAGLSAVTIALTYLVGARAFGPTTGLLASAILGFAPLAVREAHFAKPDSAAAFAATLLLLTFTTSWRRPLLRSLAIGVAAGLVVSTKFCVGLLPGAAVAAGTPAPRSRWPAGAASLALATAVGLSLCAAINPFLRRPLGEVAATVFDAIARTDARAWVGHEAVTSPMRYYAEVGLWYGVGHASALLALPALVAGLWRPGPPRWIAIATAGYLAVLFANGMVLARYALPAVPGLAVLVSAMVVSGVAPVGRRRVLGSVVAALLLGLLVLQPLAASARLVTLLGRTDTRALASEWIDRHLPKNATIALYGAPTMWTGYGNPGVGGRRALVLTPAKRWEAEGVQYVVSHWYPMPYANRPAPEDPRLKRLASFDPFDSPSADPVVEPMDAFFLPLGRFTGVVRPGPRIQIFELSRQP